MATEEPVACPVCGELDVEALSESRNKLTLQCVECSHVWTTSPPHLRLRELPIVISDEEESTKDLMTVATADLVHLGDEFEHAGHRLMVTSIEVEGRHVNKAKAGEITVMHAKVFDTVPLKISVNEADVTRSYRIDVEPEFEVHIGQVLEVQGMKLAVKTLKSDQNRTLHKGFLLARNIRRAFCDPVKRRRVRPGQRVPTRPRGAPPGAKTRRR